MRWLSLTIGLLTACVCLLGWIYLRDRDPNWRPPEQQIARADAIVADDVLGSYCGSHCVTHLLGQTEPHSWLVSLTLGGRTECLVIDIDRFTTNSKGLVGVKRHRCPPHRGPS